MISPEMTFEKKGRAVGLHHQRRAVVTGDSIAGLFVAAFLCRIVWQVDLYLAVINRALWLGHRNRCTRLEFLETRDKCGAGIVDIVVTGCLKRRGLSLLPLKIVGNAYFTALRPPYILATPINSLE